MKLACTINATGREHGPAGPCVPWWSFTKTVIAVACFRAAELGLLDLDAPAWPGGAALHQVLRHEAGLPDYGAWPDYHAAVDAGGEPWPASAVIARGIAAARPPGDWAYSNIGYALAARVLAEAAGGPLNACLADLVLKPAGAGSARLALRAEDLEGVAGVRPGYHPGWVLHGLLVGELRDAARVARALVAGRLLQPSSLAELLRPTPLPQFRTALWPEPAYGAGVMLPRLADGRRLVGHTGAGPGGTVAVYALKRPGDEGAAAAAAAAFGDGGEDAEAVVMDLVRRVS